MVPTVQGLGRLDDKLAARDDEYVAGKGYVAEGFDLFDFSDHITLSYLWVLGAYEIVRVINQRERNAQSALSGSINGLLKQFARLRMPLAKFEPAERHQHTDAHIAYPALSGAYGVAWRVAEHIYISRRELSEGLLTLLEDMSK